MWWRLLRPAFYVNSVQDIDPAVLSARGVRGIACDLDNTLAHWNSPEPSPDLAAWIARVRSAGLSLCLVSNNGRDRVAAFADRFEMPFVADAGKPLSRGYRRAMAILGTAPGETAVVGDQVFTDVLGGNRLGCLTILVRPLSRREFAGTRLVRRIERLVLSRLGPPLEFFSTNAPFDKPFAE